jgi:adenosylcobinamide kinase/adenosylcobinamide-phosphate guanylyltransferase
MYLTGLFLAAPESDSDDEAVWTDAEGEIAGSVERIFSNFAASPDGGKRMIVVSGEVGSGVVPESRLGRRFRDLQGRANQIAARLADEVVLVVAGLPLWVKREGRADERTPG